jgi:putative sigma-54 modulation protein
MKKGANAMHIKINYRHMTSTPGLEETTRTKSEKLQKYWNGKINLEWTFSVEKQAQIAHCHLTGDHLEFFAESRTDNAYKAIDEVIDHLEAQLRKNKELLRDHHIQRREAAKITSNVE